MQTLSVLAVEDGAIIVASPAGERFRLPVDAALRARIASPTASSGEKRLSPREIQAHVRAGLTAEQVAAMTGVPVAFIERFVGPVLAERAYIVESALAVRLPPETEGARARTFGAVMGERLDALAAKEIRWTSAKEPSGWILAVAFVADDVQHSARWRFDPKHMRLDADNVEASTLSQQGVPAALTPRLRAIEPTAPVTIVPPAATAPTTAPAPAPARPPQLHGARVAPVPPAEPDATRFDSAVFRFPPIEPGPKQDQEQRRNPAAHAHQPTTDQLADLQRRRGVRQPAPEPGLDTDSLPVTRAMDVVETGDVFAPRPTADRDATPQPRREPASIHRLPVRTPPPSADEQPTAPIPPAFARPAPGMQQTARPTPAPPRTGNDPSRRRRDRSGFGALEPVDPSSATGQRRSSAQEQRPTAHRDRGGAFEPAIQQDQQDQQEQPSEKPAVRAHRDRGGAFDPALLQDQHEQPSETPAVRPRRGRTSMPSWDEIVFGRDEP